MLSERSSRPGVTGTVRVTRLPGARRTLKGPTDLPDSAALVFVTRGCSVGSRSSVINAALDFLRLIGLLL
jgi:hypothetical protein